MKDEIIANIKAKVIASPPIIVSFKECSYDSTNDRYLVESSVKTINFDKLTKRLGHKEERKSADALSLNDSRVFLIEFKAGNQVNHENKVSRLISGVSGKINGSDETLRNDVFVKCFQEESDYPKLSFYLVVDSKEIGADIYARELAQLSLGASANDYERTLYARVLPNLKSNCTFPDHFCDIDIWYSELFDTYLRMYNIPSMDIS